MKIDNMWLFDGIYESVGIGGERYFLRQCLFVLLLLRSFGMTTTGEKRRTICDVLCFVHVSVESKNCTGHWFQC